MKNTITLLIVCLTVVTTAFGQNCGVESAWFQEQIQSFDPNAPRPLSSEIRYVPFTVNFVRNTNGTPGQNENLDQLYHSLVMTNKIMSEAGIQLYIDGTINTINNSDYLNVTRGSTTHNALLAEGNPNTANIWVVDGWQGSQASGWGGPGLGIELADVTLNTFPHEFGHFLTLAHTFETRNGIELVSRTKGNCSTSGDQICDTEADPYDLSNGEFTGELFSHESCQMTSNTKDANGELYTPPFENMMSYFGGACGYLFTPGQYARMSAGFDQYHTSYTPIAAAKLATAPIRLSITSEGNKEILTWLNAPDALATNIEISADGGDSWRVFGGTVGAIQSHYLEGNSNQSYKIRLRHINSLSYSSSIDYTPTITQQEIPVYQLRDAGDLGAIASFKLKNTEVKNTSDLNENYSIWDFQSGNQLIKGGTYEGEFKTKVVYVGSEGQFTYRSTYFAAWIDKNHDGDFDDQGEELFTQDGETPSRTLTRAFTIPADALEGQTRLRIRGFSQSGRNNASDFFSRLETEDYLVELISDKAPLSLAGGFNETIGGVELTWQDNTAAFRYAIERTSNGFDYTVIGTVDGNQTSYLDQSIFPNQQYEYRVRRENGFLVSNSAKVNVGVSPITYCAPLSTNGCNIIKLTSFSIPSSDFTNSGDDCNNGYSDYTYQSIDLTAGNTVNFDITSTEALQGFGNLAVFLDVDRNGSFEPAERLFNHTDVAVSISSGAISIPSNAMNGETRLRIRRYYSSIADACGTASYGETEDYTVNILSGRPKGVAEVSVSDVQSSSLVINWVNGDLNTPTSYRIEVSEDGVNFTPLYIAQPSETSYQVNDLRPNTRYTFKIVTVSNLNSDGVNVWATTLTAPSGSTQETPTTFVNSNTSGEVVYPNPFSGTLNIGIDYDQVSIYDVSGRLILAKKIKESLLDVSSIVPGVYFLELNKGNYNTQVKIIKQ